MSHFVKSAIFGGLVRGGGGLLIFVPDSFGTVGKFPKGGAQEWSSIF